MSPAEFEARLNAMDEYQFAAFKRDYGGDNDRARYIQEYTRNQAKMEPILCRILKMPTEAEKQDTVAEATLRAEQQQATEATQANELAREANRIAHRANRIAYWACAFAAFALIVSITAVIVAAYRP